MNQVEKLRADIQRHYDKLAAAGREKIQLMEVCGTHTIALARGGLLGLMPKGLRLVSGPGCPVCVTDQSYMDQAVWLAKNRPDVIVATYGDMIRVPGRAGSLEDARTAGAEIALVYAAHEAVELARRRPEKHVVFLAVGFETTTPATALAIDQARKGNVRNFSVFTAHKLVLPAMNVLLSLPDIQIDGFMCPGHVSVILGYKAYQPLVDKYRRPCVVAGFDEEQILAGVAEILRELAEDDPRACTVYPPVTAEGNKVAQKILADVFHPADAPWRAIGVLPGSGLELNDEYAEFDTTKRIELPPCESYEMPGCRCGQVICGRAIPTECPLFGKVCTPRHPIGPCMVSSEGSCAAYYKYHWRG